MTLKGNIPVPFNVLRFDSENPFFLFLGKLTGCLSEKPDDRTEEQKIRKKKGEESGDRLCNGIFLIVSELGSLEGDIQNLLEIYLLDT